MKEEDVIKSINSLDTEEILKVVKSMLNDEYDSKSKVKKQTENKEEKINNK
jgi:hypothetical protein